MKNIYMIENTITKEKYIGQTKRSIKVRFAEHIRTSKRLNSRLSQTKFYENMRQYGEENFIITLLEIVEDNLADEKEKFWIDKYNTVHNGLNTSYGGMGKSLYNKQIEEKVCDLYNSGKTINDISTIINFSCDTVAKILHSNHIKIDCKKYYIHSVVMLDKNNLFIKNFNSYKEAYDYLVENNQIKCNYTCFSHKIREVIKGKRKSAYGYKWK